MPTTAITDAIVVPQDPGTSPSDTIGFATDPPSAASVALMTAYQSGAGNYVLNGDGGSLAFTVDDVNDELTIDPGVCYIAQSASGARVQSQTGSTYDVDLPGTVEFVYAVILPTAVTVGLDADVENTVYLSVDPDTRNSATAHAGNALGAPSDPSIELGTVDSAAGTTVARANDRPDGVYDVIDAGSVSASDSITDPAGNKVTDLSDPVRVTEEAVTFAESDVAVTDNKTVAANGSIFLGTNGNLTGNVTDRPDDSNSLQRTDKSGMAVNPNTKIGGVKADVSSLTSGVTKAYLTDSDLNVIEETDVSSGTFRFERVLQTGTTYGLLVDDGGDTFTEGYDDSDTGLYPFTGSDLDITAGKSGFDSSFGADAAAVALNNIESLGLANDGDALIELGSGAAADIKAYDLVTFQRTLDGETMMVDVEDSNGNVLKSDISPNTDISDIPTDTEIQFRSHFSRQDTSNNPTLDYLALRVTR